MGKYYNLIGQKFNKLTVLELNGINKKGDRVWKCICDCGNTEFCFVTTHNLKNGNTKSCGCYQKEMASKANMKYPENEMIGKKFNRLTIEKYMGRNKFDKRMFLCKCECGNTKEIIVPLNALLNNNTRSCGCLQKEITSKNTKKYNDYVLSDDGKYYIGSIDDEKYFYIDFEDLEIAKKYYWNENSHGYLRCNYNQKDVMLHVLVMKQLKDFDSKFTYVDHIGHNLSDCRKNNLRLVTPLQSSANTGLRKNNKSGCTGVSWYDKGNCWRSRISVNREEITLGYFNNLDSAIKARKDAEIKYQKEYSYDASMEKYKESNDMDINDVK
jgi:hypothetical protein